MESREESVPVAGPALAYHVHDSAGSMSELRTVTRGENLKLQNRILIERSCWPTIDRVTVWHAVKQEDRVPASFSEDGRRGVGSFIRLPIDRNSRNQLHQVKVVPSVDRHLLDLLWQDGLARGGDGGL